MIIPSIDLLNGKAVQLQNGKKIVIECSEDIINLADTFSKYGPLCVVDLNGALNGPKDTVNLNIIKRLCQNYECRVGGGIRSVDKAQQILSWGASKIIIGSKAFNKNLINAQFLNLLSSKIDKSKIIIAIDAFEKKIVTHGWKEKSNISIFSCVKKLEKYAGGLIFTSVENEGCLNGIDKDTIKEILAITSLPLVYAGGIKDLNDIEILARLNVDAQIGMALYTGLLELKDMFCATIDWSKGLIPAIITDTYGQLLMQAYMNKEACHKTLTTGEMWYFSRSRKSLWKKGEISGNKQKFVQVRTDCDNDSLLFTVEQHYNACHKNQYGCFSDKFFSFQDLYEVIEDRLSSNSANSYTASLSVAQVRKKIIEEAFELTDAKSIEEVIWEAADCFYFILVYCAHNKVSLKSVIQELERRRKQ